VVLVATFVLSAAIVEQANARRPNSVETRVVLEKEEVLMAAWSLPMASAAAVVQMDQWKAQLAIVYSAMAVEAALLGCTKAQFAVKVSLVADGDVAVVVEIASEVVAALETDFLAIVSVVAVVGVVETV
jgi:hypothetical protein